MVKVVMISGFPTFVSKEDVKIFLEKMTGEGTVSIQKLRLTKKRNQRRRYAVVVFSDSAGAEQILTLINRSLMYRNYYLKGQGMEDNIAKVSETVVHCIAGITIHFGCQISNDRFSSLWTAQNISFDFGASMRKICFYVSYSHVQYKLELPRGNIWQIQLQRPSGQAAKFLLIQLYGAPLIYKIDTDMLANEFEGSPSEKVPDDKWIRTTDFTTSCSIGQSSGLCLELPQNHKLPYFGENFAFYRENEGQFLLDRGSPFSHNLDLVPIIDSPEEIDLPFDILFKINSLVQNGCLAGPAVDSQFFRLVDPKKRNIAFIEKALDVLSNVKECCYNPIKWLNEQYKRYSTSKLPPRSVPMLSNAGLVTVRRVQITPTKVYFCGPEVLVSNRVLRHYRDDIDNFLRVSFIDEDWNKIQSTDLSPRIASETEDSRTKIYMRIISILKNGIVISNRKFEFLAFSSSQLRENSVWMFASRAGLSAREIRNWMGDFRSIKNVAKYAARLGQSFGSSTETLNVSRREILRIPDIQLAADGITYNFSDGIGKISSEFARKVSSKCGIKGPNPSAFQIRYGGYKGVVAVDPTMASSKKLALRESMCKYESDNTKLDVLAWSKFQPCYLNRQLITLLSTLGVEDYAFERKQTDIINQLNTIITDPLKAWESLELMSPGENTNILRAMLKVGYQPDAEPFLKMMLHTFRASKLFELRTKSRILVENGRAMMGCLDERRTLEYGQVFVQYSSTRSSTQKCIARGKVVVAKNPCLHPGDVRVLTAVDVRSLHHMVDCIVFPQKGERPHPNECSGSDLDGDIYFVCWDSDLIPPDQVSPMDYAPAKSISLDHDVTIEEVEEYFVNYILNDSLGIIANTHTAFADQDGGKAMSDRCKELAKLFSIAVDFPKTGVPAVIPSRLRVHRHPDFMENSHKEIYESQNVLGKLYREVKNLSLYVGSKKFFTQEIAKQSYDYELEVYGFEDYIDDAIYYKDIYDRKLRNLMRHYGINTEAEFLSGNITKKSKTYNKKDAEAMRMAAKSLRNEARAWLYKKSTSNFGNEDVYAKASAWYHVTYHPNYWCYHHEGRNHEHYISFPWCVHDKLIRIKKDAQRNPR